MKPEPEVPDSGWLTRTRMACASWLARFANERYRPFLEKCLRNHASVGGFFLIFVFEFGIVRRRLPEECFLPP